MVTWEVWTGKGSALGGRRWGDREVALWLHVKGRFRRQRVTTHPGSLGEAGQGYLYGSGTIYIQPPNNDVDEDNKYLTQIAGSSLL